MTEYFSRSLESDFLTQLFIKDVEMSSNENLERCAGIEHALNKPDFESKVRIWIPNVKNFQNLMNPKQLTSQKGMPALRNSIFDMVLKSWWLIMVGLFYRPFYLVILGGHFELSLWSIFLVSLFSHFDRFLGGWIETVISVGHFGHRTTGFWIRTSKIFKTWWTPNSY